MINAKLYKDGLFLDEQGRLFRESKRGGIEYCYKHEYDNLDDWCEAYKARGIEIDRTEHVRFYGHVYNHIAVIDPRGITAIIAQ